LRNLGVYGRKMLKLILNNKDLMGGTGFKCLWMGSNGGHTVMTLNVIRT